MVSGLLRVHLDDFYSTSAGFVRKSPRLLSCILKTVTDRYLSCAATKLALQGAGEEAGPVLKSAKALQTTIFPEFRLFVASPQIPRRPNGT